MDILHLTYFLEVAKHKSFTKASQALHISQPSISKSIRTLEDEWGHPLFRRAGRHIELTDEGYAILPKVDALLAQFKQLEAQATSPQNLHHGSLHIGIPPMIGSSFLPTLLRDFIHEYPHIDLHIVEDGSTHIATRVQEGQLQVGFVALPIPPTEGDRQLESYIFNDEPLQIVLPKDSPLARKALIQNGLSLDDIKNEPLVFFTQGFSLYYRIISAYQHIGAHPHIVAQSDNWDFIVEMVKAGLGLALLPTSICQRLSSPEYIIVSLLTPIPWRLAMIWEKDSLISTTTRLWVSYFKNVFPEIK